ncbi:MAG TPA: cache domain-containing protein [Anaerolineales bacterium]|nr:cache domain-containing protein [Anaerolineales bacterium]
MRFLYLRRRGLRSPIATKLILSFLLVIAVISVAFMAAGVRLIRNRIVAEAQEKVRHDLNAAREIYLGELRHVSDVIRFTADRTLLIDMLLSGDADYAVAELLQVLGREGLDFLTVTDVNGIVLLRTSNPASVGDSQLHDELVRAVIETGEPVAGTVIVRAEDLQRESPLLAERARIPLIDTPMARERPEDEETDGMVLKAAAPVIDDLGQMIGIVYGGILLNQDFGIVDQVKQTVYEDMTYRGQDIGTATIFQDDVRISTNVRNADGTRAIGTRIAEDVYDRVVREGLPWIGRAFVVNNWYITAYEPITDINDRIIGILYVGVLEQRYLDIERETVLVFLGITLLGAFVSMALSYVVARRISVPVRKLASAAREVAQGNLETKVEIVSGDELGELAEAFNVMATALKERDERLKDYTTKRIIETERLALIGQLSANVAHELNNPLQGIVTYSHLLLERLPCEDSTTASIRKIVAQADRCREIIRGLLDFSRQRKPDKTVCSLNSVLLDCLSLVENQASFHNITIEKDLQADLPTAVIDPSQIERVIMNMIINASEAMEAGGRLRIATRHDPRLHQIEVEFSDTGHGIPQEHLDKIFDPFFTTKEVGHGTGLGLAISYGIVREHHGTISVESEVGKGTTFLIRLPMSAEEEGVGRGERVPVADH